jgi:hypothetical protein
MPLSKDQLHSAIPAIVAHLQSALPSPLFDRLKFGRAFITHGTRGTQQLLEIWDLNQNALLPKAHFKYCIVYDPLRLNPGAGPSDDGYYHAWLNTTRIYRDRRPLTEALRSDIRRLPLTGFELDIQDRAISAGTTFIWPRAPLALAATIGTRLAALISTLHPVLIPVIDQLAAAPGPDGDRAAPAGSPGVLNRERLRDYTRSIPPSWRASILARQHHRCADPACAADLHTAGHHIDHIIPFSRGGTSDLPNLQALCPACNLRKSNRLPPAAPS